jgi:hypothetical protein
MPELQLELVFSLVFEDEQAHDPRTYPDTSGKVRMSRSRPGRMARMSRSCECGSKKTPGAEACDRCMFLDGVTLQDLILLDALRLRGGVATAEELEIDSGWSHRQVLRALERLKDGGHGNGRIARLETGEENHFNMPVFVLTDARAPKQEEEPDPWGQLVLAAWAALCKHVRIEVVVSERGVVCGHRCQACGHLHAPDADANETGDETYSDEREGDDDRDAWTDERCEPADEHTPEVALEFAHA